MKNKNHRQTKNPASDFLLRRKGRKDARKGEPVVVSHLARMVATEMAEEYRLTQETEQTLHPTRINAARALTLNRASEHRAGNVPSPLPGSTAEDIRANRARDAALADALAGTRKSADSIVELHEQIVRENTLLQEEILHRRELTNRKIHAYLAGVHSSKELPVYDPGVLFEGNPAYEMYLRQHSALDSQIRAAAEEAWKKKEE